MMAEAVFDLDPEHPVNRYQATSDIAQAAASDLRSAGQAYPPDVLSSYLGLPALDSRIPQLAKQITASADNNYDRAAALETYLRTHFGYSLQLSRTVPHDPLANFLFERKQGHCEYFASSMAVMLRTLGIPSRVVNGFRTGEFNDLTSQYVVRASNAHSWVEAYFPGHGWVAFRSHSGGIDRDEYGLEPDIHVRRCHGLVLAGVDRQLRRGPPAGAGGQRGQPQPPLVFGFAALVAPPL